MIRVQPMPERGDVPIPAPRWAVLPPCPVDPARLLATGAMEGPARSPNPIRSLVGFLLQPSPDLWRNP